jgi:type I site-specific restriction-modification system R (restriction) subunit
MSSAWGKSWGLAFGAAFGLLATAPVQDAQANYYGSGSRHDDKQIVQKVEKPNNEAQLKKILDNFVKQEGEQAEKKRLADEARRQAVEKKKAIVLEKAIAKEQERQRKAEEAARIAQEKREAARLVAEAKRQAKEDARQVAIKLGQDIRQEQQRFKQAERERIKAEKQAQAIALAEARRKAHEDEQAKLAAKLANMPPIESPIGEIAQSKRDKVAEEDQIMALMAMMLLED